MKSQRIPGPLGLESRKYIWATQAQKTYQGLSLEP